MSLHCKLYSRINTLVCPISDAFYRIYTSYTFLSATLFRYDAVYVLEDLKTFVFIYIFNLALNFTIEENISPHTINIYLMHFCWHVVIAFLTASAKGINS